MQVLLEEEGEEEISIKFTVKLRDAMDDGEELGILVDGLGLGVGYDDPRADVDYSLLVLLADGCFRGEVPYKVW